MMKFAEIFRALPQSDQIALINEMPKINKSTLKNNIREGGLLYVLNYQKHKLSGGVRNALEQRLITLGHKWLNGNLKMNYAKHDIASTARSNAPVYDMLFNALHEEGANPLNMITRKIKNRPLTFKNMPLYGYCLLYTSPSPRDRQKSRMPSSA